MNKIHKILLAAVLLLGLFPITSSAAALAPADLAAFLEETSWNEKDLDTYLQYFYDMSINDFDTIADLKETLGEPITEENLQQLMKDYEFANEQDLVSFLVENGEMEKGDNVRNVFRYIDALDSTVGYYKEDSGTPITDENLKTLLGDHHLTMKELTDLLAKNDDSLENYKTIEDLDLALTLYESGKEALDLVSKLGITEKEMEAITKHFETIDVNDPAIEEKMTELEPRLLALREADQAADLTEGQITEVFNIMKEMLSLVHLDASFYLVKGNEKIALSDSQLIKMKDTNGHDLLIEIYNTDGVFLADMLITEDMFSTELIDNTVKDIKKVEKIEKIVQKTASQQKPHTVKGGKLPNTAGNYAEGIFVGLILIGTGLFFFRKRNVSTL
ncbi:processed acidic surface protein [Neobacillus sp. PS3-34]|uniref:processed acidic surface protein n=1 Tax=Neobacillus sp. PS3-34 TaxID=3070678 RepID=UPI0027DF25B6|nr:processed acidic surface protein [Neobacillus sp. PS3-34]WML46832.1 processed acidic surface protein [Neobacillus sp. PS3-34]